MSGHLIQSNTIMTPEQLGEEEKTAEVCLNWWPTPSLSHAEPVPGMPHLLCRVCANWLPDIEDMGIVQNSKKSGCGNVWSKERNILVSNKNK